MRWERFPLPLALILVLSAWRAGAPRETDPYWQIREGREFLAGQPLIHPDTWSWSPNSAPVIPNSPGWNVLLSTAYSLGGWIGFFLLSLIAIGGCLLAIQQVAQTLGARKIPTSIAVLVSFALIVPVLSARASALAFTLLLAALWVGNRLSRIEVFGKTQGIAAVATSGFLISLVGNWLHTSWGLLSFVLIALWGIQFVGIRPRGLLTWSISSVLVLIGLLLGPYGLKVFSIAARVRSASVGLILEWSPIWDTPQRLFWIPVTFVMLLSSGGVAFWLLRHWVSFRRADADQRLMLNLSLCGFSLTVAGLVHSRFTFAVGMFLGPLVAYWISNPRPFTDLRWVNQKRYRMALRERLSDDYLRVIAIGVTLVLAFPSAVAASNLGRPRFAEAVRYLPKDCKLFASESSAAILLRPDIKIWIDGRADYWGRERLKEFITYFNGNSLMPVPKGTDCVLFSTSPVFSTLDKRLSQSPGWKLIRSPERTRIWSSLNSEAAGGS